MQTLLIVGEWLGQHLATPILVSLLGWGIAEFILWRRQRASRKQTLIHLQGLLSKGEENIWQCRDIEPHEWPLKLRKQVSQTTMASEWRVACFNQMQRELGDFLYNRAPELTPMERKEILDALNWFHTPEPGSLYAKPIAGKLVFPFVNSHTNPPHPTWLVDSHMETIVPMPVHQEQRQEADTEAPPENRQGFKVHRLLVCPVLHEGRWPVTDMSEDQARDVFKKLEALDWLDWRMTPPPSPEGTPHRE